MTVLTVLYAAGALASIVNVGLMLRLPRILRRKPTP